MLLRPMRKSVLVGPLVSIVALTFYGACMQAPWAVAQDREAVTGWWSRVLNRTGGRVREVVELRPDGTYTTGLCMLATQMGWCAGKALPQIQGNYSLRGATLALQHGLMPQKSLDDLGRPDTPRRSLTHGQSEVYQWRLQVIPASPPTGRPPARRLSLKAVNNQSRQFNDMSTKAPGWHHH